ncbi:hypothetical protein [Bifidobacterium stellenboschense]|uniref:Uncharacterized protein n=1 Tax=Bifidobacterium stellenboschense TaxID=762211 RepID=A0A087DZJ8_9BIFI|nr:hypothetical protein [Bifidobacterium stellenboschense]KFJ00949.1 hypothetical protein BSTEL_0361 [Bifidobacterium stellenboschense]
MDGIRLGTWLGYAMLLVMLAPVVIPAVLVQEVTRHVAATRLALFSRGGLVVRPASFAVLLTLTVVTLSIGMAGGFASDTSGTALAVVALAASCAVIVIATVVGVAVHALALCASCAGRKPLPRDFRFDAVLCDKVRSWARPQWVPRWARYTLPEPRI